MATTAPPPKKEARTCLDLSRFLDKRVSVKFIGGREVFGVLRGYDNCVNIVLDDTEEYLRDPANPEIQLDDTRKLGLLVAKGTAVMVVCPLDGVEEIENPFVNEDAQQ